MSIDKVLGQKTEYPQTYEPDILVREDRQPNRDLVGLDGSSLPFQGYDIWNAYEISGITGNGFPVAGIAKIVYSCDSKYIVESKSIKLYFNSFNMHQCGDGPLDVMRYIEETAARDLSSLLETSVHVVIHPASIDINTVPIFTGLYQTLEDRYGSQAIQKVFDVYTETPSLLRPAHHGDGGKVEFWHSALLKSNCKVTSQPDWGDVYIMINGETTPEPTSLLEYIISFRNECHFHEEICETIYKRLSDAFKPKELVVTCLYARRGGIDINPTRASDPSLLNTRLIDPSELHTKTTKQ